MKILIEDIDEEMEEEVIIRCRTLSPELIRLIAELKAKEKKIIGYQGSEIVMMDMDMVYYFEAVDNKVFLYLKDKVYESKLRLYEIEQQYKNTSFLRISKSIILNIRKIRHLSPAFSGRLEATLWNDERVIISRQYVGDLKKQLGL